MPADPGVNVFTTFLKGAAMGAANVIPGVSGGTIAFITGIYERLIRALKSFDLAALRMALRFDVRGLLAHIDFPFLAALGAGVVVSILSLAKLFEFLFMHHEVAVWAFFFGLILASIPTVVCEIKHWGAGPVIAAILGCALAAGLAFVPRAGANDSLPYVFLCGVVAISSMIIPGVSGSFVLLLMGNYFLVLGAISGLELPILVPFGLGCVVGLAALSRLLAWIFSRYHDVAVALISGFVAGSLLIIWPWKDTVFEQSASGSYVVKTADRELVERGADLAAVVEGLGEDEELITVGYTNWQFPSLSEKATYVHLALMLIAAVIVLAGERAAAKHRAKKSVHSST